MAHQRGYEQMWEDILAKHRINSMGSSSSSSGGPKIIHMIFRGLPQEITPHEDNPLIDPVDREHFKAQKEKSNKSNNVNRGSKNRL